VASAGGVAEILRVSCVGELTKCCGCVGEASRECGVGVDCARRILGGRRLWEGWRISDLVLKRKNRFIKNNMCAYIDTTSRDVETFVP
jgi:hypothetical protein